MSIKKKFWVDFSWIVFFIIVFILVKLCVVGLYLVPSPSMLPSLIPGDRIITNKLAYGLSLPFLQKPITQWATPNRGDVIVFSFTDNPDIFVKRVIGLPGDLITFQEGVVSVNREPLVLRKLPQADDPTLNLFDEGNLRIFNDSHPIYMSRLPSKTFFESHRYLVPPNKYFVLGDNRDNSADSRAYGYVDSKNIYGQASFVLFSTTGESFLPKFRKERFFTGVSQ